MNDETTTVNNHRKSHVGLWSTLIIFFIIIILLLAAGGFFAYRTNQNLTQQLTFLKQQMAKEDDLIPLQQSVSEFKQALANVDTLSEKQQQLIDAWNAAQKGDLTRWHVAEAAYLVRLSNDALQYTHDLPMALQSLNDAGTLLANITDPNVTPIHQSIADAITKIKALPTVDINALYTRLMTVNQQIDQLPLPAHPLSNDATIANLPVDLPWWKRGLQYSWQALKKIVVVKNISGNTLPLVLPEEKVFLSQNLHSEIENASWGLLHHNQLIYQTSLQLATNWIQQYYILSAPVTITSLNELQALQKENITAATVNLTDTMQLFDHYFAQ
jgi:uroporphyrin-III C-methyltransferase